MDIKLLAKYKPQFVSFIDIANSSSPGTVIFDEGEWEKAALPSLLLLIMGVISVSTMNWRGEQS